MRLFKKFPSRPTISKVAGDILGPPSNLNHLQSWREWGTGLPNRSKVSTTGSSLKAELQRVVSAILAIKLWTIYA